MIPTTVTTTIERFVTTTTAVPTTIVTTTAVPTTVTTSFTTTVPVITTTTEVVTNWSMTIVIAIVIAAVATLLTYFVFVRRK
jgi:hypothetical protein